MSHSVVSQEIPLGWNSGAIPVCCHSQPGLPVCSCPRCYWGSLSYSCERDSDPPDVQPCWTLAIDHPWRMSDNSQKNPHNKSWFPRRTFWGHSGSAPAGTKLALCFWRALRRELTTSVSWTPRTLKCFVHARRTPWKVTVQWPKSTQTLAHKPQSPTRLKCVEKSTMSLHTLKLSQNQSEQNILPWGACQYQHNQTGTVKDTILQMLLPVLHLKHMWLSWCSSQSNSIKQKAFAGLGPRAQTLRNKRG